MRIGFTKSYRKELDSDIWKMPPLYQRVFFYLRQEAVWQPESFPTRKVFNIALNPGQLITSFSIIANGVAWYEYGVKKVPNKKIIKDILGWLEGNSMVTVYSNRHGTFIVLTNWDTYNAIEAKKVTQKKLAKVTQKKRNVDTLKEGLEVKEKKKEIYTPDFLQFWEIYPKKKGKGDAYKAYNKINGGKPSFEIISASIETQKKSEQWQNKKYIPHPATWLNARGWEDEDECDDIGTSIFDMELKRVK